MYSLNSHRSEDIGVAGDDLGGKRGHNTGLKGFLVVDVDWLG